MNDPSQTVKRKISSGIRRIRQYTPGPSFLIVGTQKGGTTALYQYLDQHPQVIAPQKKEIDFFAHTVLYERGSTAYHRHFPTIWQLGLRGKTFESSPQYLYYPGTAERIHAYRPQMKIIIMLREPAARAYSAWTMFRKYHRNGTRFEKMTGDPGTWSALTALLSRERFPTFEEVIEEEWQRIEAGDALIEPSFVRRGLYAEQIRRYLACFDREQLLIIENERMMRDTTATMRRVEAFLGLSPFAWETVDLAPRFKTTYNETMHPETRTRLQAYYRPHNEALFELLGDAFDWEFA